MNLFSAQRRCAGLWLAAMVVIGLCACTPALNWREVRLDRLAALLPCKPDQGMRTVQLAWQALPMRMVGCEADGGLFAISHVHLPDTDVAPIVVAWRASALEKMQSTAVQESAAALKLPGGTVHPLIHAKGSRASGEPVQAQLLWVDGGKRYFSRRRLCAAPHARHDRAILLRTASAMTQAKAIAVFGVFAAAYFISALIRAITATLAPTLVQEFSLQARDLGLLAGAYFLGFAAIQLPLGRWLDRFGPKRVVLCFLAIAVLGCVAFAMASNFTALLAARALCGVGVSACLMAPLTGYRRWYAPASQMRANSWMLMVGALGMVASTLPVQWLLPLVGWRPLFAVMAGMVVLAMLMIAWQVPSWANPAAPSADAEPPVASGYAEVWRNPYFRRLAPLGFFNFGGLVAMQTLWAAPWMINVAHYTPLEAATGLFWINVAMLLSFWMWGLANPWLARHGLGVNQMLTLGMPISLLVIAIISIAGDAISTMAGALWILYCVSSTVGALAQPAVGMAFRPELAGRALSAYNLVIFCGVFSVQWGVGLVIDGLRVLGWAEVAAYQGAIGSYGLCCLGAYLYFLWAKKP